MLGSCTTSCSGRSGARSRTATTPQVLLAGDLLRLALMLVFAAVVARDGPVALVIALAALSSAAGSAEQPASLALLPRLVGERRLGPPTRCSIRSRTWAWSSARRSALLLAVPRAGGFPGERRDFAVSAVLVSTLPRQRSPGAKDRGGAAGVLAGVRTARVTPFVIPLFVLVAMVELTYGAQTVQLSSTPSSRWISAPAATGSCSQARAPAA